MKSQYDIAIIGGGISGLMCAYRLINKNPKLNICIIEKGMPLHLRKCPSNDVIPCKKCTPCSIVNGIAGAGAFSDGKYIISTEYGGWLPKFINNDNAIKYIKEVDNILVNFGATKDVYMPDNELKQYCLKFDLHMQQAVVKHLGTDKNYYTMMNFVKFLSDKIDVFTNADVHHITKLNGKYHIDSTIETDVVVIATGRSGSQLIDDFCKENKISMVSNQVDIGVRVELPQLIWDEFEKKIYEPKIWYRTKQYGDIVRMFCFCGSGYVKSENTNGVVTVNGHSTREQKTDNTNFALLSSINFTQPFNDPIRYAKYIASLANMISDNGIIVQRFGDLINGRRTTDKRLSESSTKPSLKATAGDLSLVIPKRQLDNIIETIYQLDKVAMGTANNDTLLYGVETKYYSARPIFKSNEFDVCDNVYIIGDGSGVTRSLSHAGAMGLYVADVILSKDFIVNKERNKNESRNDV